MKESNLVSASNEIAGEVTLPPLMSPLQVSLASVLEASPTAIVTTTPTGVISGWSWGAEQLFGYSPDEIIGQKLEVLAPPEHAQIIAQRLDRLKRGEDIAPYEAPRITKTGELIIVEVSLTVLREEGHFAGLMAIMWDVQARRHAQEIVSAVEISVQQRAVVQDTANRVALDILSARTGVEALRHIAEAARVLAGARYAAIGVARQDARGLQEFITVGLTPQEEAAIGSLPQGNGILGFLLERDTPLRVDVLSQHPRSVRFPPNHPPMSSFLGVPIRRGETVLGSLYLTNKIDGDHFTQADEVAVGALGAHAAVAIHSLHMLARQRLLVSGFVTAQENERRTIAYELHDGLTQYVMASHAHLSAFKRAQDKGQADKAVRELEHGLRYLHEAVVESRRMVNGLRLLALEDLGLAGALEQLLNDEKTRAGWEVELVQNVSHRRFDSTLEIAVYRVAQEALTNVRKHASASRVRVRLWCEDTPETSTLHLEVRDWGQGFSQGASLGIATPGHVGIHSMSERVAVMGGTFGIESQPDEGTTVRADFPVSEILRECPNQNVIMNQSPISSRVTILLVDDHAIWRGGVRAMLDDTEFQVVGEASSGHEAIAKVRELAEVGDSPQMILLDIRMNDGDGLEALRAIKAEYPLISIVMLTTYENPTYMARAIADGASGYLLKGTGADEMLDALRRVSNGESLLSTTELKRALRGLDPNSVGASELIQPLSEREVEVLRLLSTGLCNRDIAPLLFISESTVKSHVEHIIRKLGVSDRVQAAVWAARHQLVSPE